MPIQKEHYYHPFVNSSLALFSTNDTCPENTTGCILQHIDLYYQPLEKPWIMIFFAILRSLIIIASEIIHIKLLKIIKKEKGIVCDIMKLYVCTQMVYLPFLMMSIITTDFIHPVNEVFGRWFCTCSWLVFICGGLITTSHSFIVALMRYFFIVHETKAKKFGKEKAKKIFLQLSIFIPVLIAVTGAIEGSEITWMSFINKCYGNHYKVFLIETSAISGFQKRIFKLGDDELRSSSTIIFAILWRISKILRSSIILMMGFNVTEGILYYKTLSHLNR